MKGPGARHIFRAIDPERVANLRAEKAKQAGMPGVAAATASRIERGIRVSKKCVTNYYVALQTKIPFEHLFEVASRDTSTGSEAVGLPGGIDSLAEIIKQKRYPIATDALRLLGSDAWYMTRSRVAVEYTHSTFQPPQSMKARADNFVSVEKQKHGKKFFNGPNTRLIAFDDEGEATRLKLYTGPVDWHTFVGLNLGFSNKIKSIADYEKYLGLSRIIAHDDFSRSKVSAILSCAVTLLTRDGFVAYAMRSGSSYANAYSLTSAVAENINRYRDEVDSEDRLVWGYHEKKHAENETYQPEGIPHLFSAAERGTRLELSRKLYGSKYIRPHALKLSGIAYNMLEYHPNALFVLAIDCTKDELLSMCVGSPGEESREHIAILSTRASFDDPDTARVLADPTWDAGGKASLVRAIELIDAICADRGFNDRRDAFDVLADEE